MTCDFTDEDAERVARAIERARCPGREGPYGLYDYTAHGATTRPYHVRDFRDPAADGYGRSVFMSSDPAAARAEFDRLTRVHIGRAALAVAALRLHALATALRELLAAEPFDTDAYDAVAERVAKLVP